VTVFGRIRFRFGEEPVAECKRNDEQQRRGVGVEERRERALAWSNPE